MNIHKGNSEVTPWKLLEKTVFFPVGVFWSNMIKPKFYLISQILTEKPHNYVFSCMLNAKISYIIYQFLIKIKLIYACKSISKI